MVSYRWVYTLCSTELMIPDPEDNGYLVFFFFKIRVGSTWDFLGT